MGHNSRWGMMVVKLNRKELIRQTAIQVMAEYGYHNSTTDKIAEEAGIAVGTIYNYFRNKEQILEYIFAVELEKRQKAFVEQQQSSKPVLEKLQALLELHFAEIANNIAVGQILVREQQLPGKSEVTSISDFLQGVPQWIEELLNTAIEQGEICTCDTRIIAAAMFGAVQGVAAKAVFEEDKNIQNQILQSAPKELIHLFTGGISLDR